MSHYICPNNCRQLYISTKRCTTAFIRANARNINILSICNIHRRHRGLNFTGAVRLRGDNCTVNLHSRESWWKSCVKLQKRQRNVCFSSNTFSDTRYQRTSTICPCQMRNYITIIFVYRQLYRKREQTLRIHHFIRFHWFVRRVLPFCRPQSDEQIKWKDLV